MLSPILDHPTSEPAVFRPENLLERASNMLGKGTVLCQPVALRRSRRRYEDP